MKKNQKEILSYAFWCIMTTLVSWTSYTVYAYLFGRIDRLTPTVVALIANILSWVTAVTFSFVANKIRVFESKSWRIGVVMPEVLKFYSTRAAVGVVETGLATLMVVVGLDVPLFGVDGLVSKMIVMPRNGIAGSEGSSYFQFFKDPPYCSLDFPDSSVGKESACNAGDPASIPGSGRSAGEGIGYPLQYSGLENPTD